MTITFALALAIGLAQTPAPQKPQPKQVPPAPAEAGRPADARVSEGLRVQVMLDRAGFSPGVIDGRVGPSTRRALEAYQKQAGDGSQQPFEPLTRYRITAEDASGPFAESIPKDLVEQSKLPHLGYTSVQEAVAERFHSTPALLKQLNPAATFAEGDEILVPNVEPLVVPEAPPAQQAARGQRGREQGARAGTPGAAGTTGAGDVVITVSKSLSALTVTDPSGRVLMYAPVTTGSELDPLPIGEWKVKGVSIKPPFNYNPELFWDADPTHSKAKIPPGPNNPVGLVWIDLSKEHYGIHGTPEPTTIGKTESHGCVRLTNWDVVKLAGMVRPGTRVVFTE
jgi:lipoprotein-anchoring transpeptidase ErfK/SrfK